MAEDLGEEDIVGDVFGFELVATEGAVGASEVAGFPGLVQGAEGGGNVLGKLVVFTALVEGKLLRSRRVSRAWTSFLGSARTGMGYGSKLVPGAWPSFPVGHSVSVTAGTGVNLRDLENCHLLQELDNQIPMNKVLCVHGIGQQISGEDSVLKDWIPALRDGIRRAGEEPPLPEEIGIAFYGDLFRKKGTKSFCIPPYDENDITEEWERKLLEALWFGGAQIDKNVPGPQERTKHRTPHLVQRALNALSHSRFFAKIALNAFIADLKQVYAYFHDETVRLEAQRRIEKAVSGQARVLVAHSLGTVVAYEALCAHPEWPVRTFVSLGSPLGISNLIFELLRPAPESGVGVWPKALSHWSNIADGGDIVALVKELRTRFGHRVQDYLVHNGAHAHDVRPYLTSGETGHAIAQGLRR